MNKITCPNCGHEFDKDSLLTEEGVISILKQDPRKDLFINNIGTWHISYSSNKIVPTDVVSSMRMNGKIKRKFPNSDKVFILNE